MCLVCLDRHKEYCRRYREKHNTDADKNKRNAAIKKRKDRLREEGICINCGRRPALNGRIQCGVCLHKDVVRHQEKKYKNGSIPQSMRGDGIHCYICCRPICNGNKLCTECYKKACDGLVIGRSHIDRDKHPWRIAIKIDCEIAKRGGIN